METETEVALSRKGKLTILEGYDRISVALQKDGSIITLQGFSSKETLLRELLALCQKWPDLNT